MKKRKVNLNDIILLVLDVDGVLTDGTLILNPNGKESKAFNVHDGHGIRFWRRSGLKVAFLSGRQSEPTHLRAEQLEIEQCLENCKNKLPALKKLLDDMKLEPRQAAFIGDDLPDIPAMRYVGFAVAVANAVKEVKDYADLVTKNCGGSGAVREAIEYILKKTGKWNEVMNRYTA